MTTLRQVLYVSRAAAGVGPDDIQAVLRVSQSHNRRHDITGCLLYSGQHFVQTLEGSVEALAALVPKISSDSRHFNLITLVDHRMRLRKYPNWSMGYLYSLDLRDRVEALLRGEPMPTHQAFELMEEMKADSVMGSL